MTYSKVSFKTCNQVNVVIIPTVQSNSKAIRESKKSGKETNKPCS